MKNQTNNNIHQFGLFLMYVIFGTLGLLIIKFDGNKKNEIIINMPKDAASWQQAITNKTILNDNKAILWWSVYKYSFDRNNFEQPAEEAADEAVMRVYGNH